MNRSQQGQQSVQPRQALEGLAGIEWCTDTDKTIEGQRYGIHLFSYLNPLRSTCIQLVSETEIQWIYAQSEQSLSESPPFSGENAAALILCDGCQPNPALLAVCERQNIALGKTRLSSNDILDHLQSNLPKMLALKSVQHGVFLAVMNTGILVTGASGVGKSEVAMDLVQRGHQLIADDAVEIYRSEQNDLIGECPEPLKGYIEIRGLGIINVLKMFGPSSVLNAYRLQLIIDLQDATDSEIKKVDRLSPSLASREILGIQVPCLTMLVAPGRNLSVLVEAAVRDHLLRMSGTDSSEDFIRNHQDMMRRAES